MTLDECCKLEKPKETKRTPIDNPWITEGIAEAVVKNMNCVKSGQILLMNPMNRAMKPCIKSSLIIEEPLSILLTQPSTHILAIKLWKIRITAKNVADY